LVLFAFFHLKFAIITPALITGSFAERVRFWSYVTFITLFSLLIYCPLAHWTWHPDGFLRRWGALDFAGGTVVHMSAGLAALAGALVLGRRKLHEIGEAHVPANIPFVVLGTGMLWFGWFGFNAGSALAANEQAALAFATTNTASAAAAFGWIAFDVIRGRKASALGACIGAVVGLVAITPAAGYVSVADSLVIGTVASILSNVAVYWKSRSTIDDTLDVFPCHGVGGMVGMLATGVFAQNVGLLHGSAHVFLVQVIALLIAAPYAFVGSWLLYRITDAIIPLRVSERQELIGLDITQHDETVSSRGLRATVEALQGDLFARREP
ncbi:MAG: ammonium transporter, partial [Acidobacteriota bacterium]